MCCTDINCNIINYIAYRIRILHRQHSSRSTPTDVTEPSWSPGLASAVSRWRTEPRPPGSPVPRPLWFSVPATGRMMMMILTMMMMTLMWCVRCQVANCPGVDQSLDTSQPGFNSSCQQCLAERAEMVDMETSGKMTAETSFSPDTNNGDRFDGGCWTDVNMIYISIVLGTVPTQSSLCPRQCCRPRTWWTRVIMTWRHAARVSATPARGGLMNVKTCVVRAWCSFSVPWGWQW